MIKDLLKDLFSESLSARFFRCVFGLKSSIDSLTSYRVNPSKNYDSEEFLRLAETTGTKFSNYPSFILKLSGINIHKQTLSGIIFEYETKLLNKTNPSLRNPEPKKLRNDYNYLVKLLNHQIEFIKNKRPLESYTTRKHLNKTTAHIEHLEDHIKYKLNEKGIFSSHNQTAEKYAETHQYMDRYYKELEELKDEQIQLQQKLKNFDLQQADDYKHYQQSFTLNS